MEEHRTNKANFAEVPTCETKQISPACPEMGANREGVPQRPIMRNEPNSGPCAGREIGVPEELPRETNPICAAARAMASALCENGYDESDARERARKQSQFLLRCRSGDRRSRGRLCETNPISRLRIADRLAAGHPPRALPRRTRAGRLCKTNPIALGARRAKCAKRTQFPGVGRRAGYPAFHYSIIPPFQSDVDGAKRTQFRPSARGWARAAGAA